MRSNKLSITHLITGDLWAGAETQAFFLICEMSKFETIHLNVITFNDGILVNKLRDNNIHVDIVREKSNNIIIMLWNIFNILQKRRIDILHTHGYKETFLGGIIARLLRVKCIIRTHHGKGVLDAGFQYQIIEKLNKIFFTDMIIAVSEELKNYLLNKEYNNRVIKVLHNGVNVDEVKSYKETQIIKKDLNINENAIIIGTMGRLVKVKGHKYFIQCAEKVISERKDIIFIIAGDGPLFNEFQDEINRKQLNSGIRLLGFRNDSYDIMNIFDIFVLPSIHEGVPMVLLEAMSMGKPILATNVGGIPEIIYNRRNGILIPPMDTDALYSACLELIKDDNLRKQLGRCAKECVMIKHSIHNIVKEVVVFYRDFNS